MKTLIIDAQIWQTNAWYRGMGGYTRSLISALVRRQESLRIVLLLNKNMITGERLEAIRSELPDADIFELDLPVDPLAPDEIQAQATIQEFIQSNFSKEEDIYYFIPALFLFSYAAVFPASVKKILLFYDLTPLIYWEHFAKYFPPHLYFARFKMLLEADIIFSISETTANDISKYLGLSLNKMVNLDGSINQVKGDGSEKATSSNVIKHLGLNGKKFFLLPTGGLPNKNNVRAAKAFRLLKERVSDKSLCLVATSFFEDLDKQELRLLVGEDIIFTGNVTDQEIETLYAKCDAVLFPALYEGLGMPVLEGVANERPVACSDIAVFREIPNHQEALYMFDPYDVESMAEAMFAAIARVGFDAKKEYYPAITNKYSWERSARLFAEALDNEVFFTRPQTPLTQIAVTCPDPRKNNDVAVFAQRLYGYGLSAGVEFTYFIDPGDSNEIGRQYLPDYIRNMATCYDINDFYREREAQQFDKVMHFLSNDQQFYKQFRAALAVKGTMYIAESSYLPVIQKLADQGLITGSQLQAEQQLNAFAQQQTMFEGAALLAHAERIIAEQPIAVSVQKTVDNLTLKTRVLAVPGCTVTNKVADAKGLALQDKVYADVIEFLREK